MLGCVLTFLIMVGLAQAVPQEDPDCTDGGETCATDTASLLQLRGANDMSSSLSSPGMPLINVTVSFGALTGQVLPGGGAVWQGIPYATHQRFADPTDWNQPYVNGHRSALTPGPICPQKGDVGPEDCLFLNVWRSETVGQVDSEPAPVMLWLHGGGFTAGSGDLYNASLLVQGRHIIVITINYRLGVLGWLSLGKGASNFGLKDQRSAFRWAAEQSVHFGGDPQRLMIFGESAGAISVGLHMVSPPSFGLFRRALMESGDLFALPTSTGRSMMVNLCIRMGCDYGDVNCLRKSNLTDLLTEAEVLAPSFPNGEYYMFPVSGFWWPVVDDCEVLAPPLHLFDAGRIAPDVDLLVGTNQDEGTPFIYWGMYDLNGRNLSMSATAYRNWLSVMLKKFSDCPATVDASKPSPVEGDNRAHAARDFGDYAFTCPARVIARSVSKVGQTAYSYRFDVPSKKRPPQMGCPHGAELTFIWYPYAHPDDPVPFSPDDQRLSTRMKDAWAAFAATGKPTENPTGWPEYTTERDTVAVLAPIPEGQPAGFVSEEGWRCQACEFWEKFLVPPS